MTSSTAAVRIEDSRAKKGFWGVWLEDKPCGRVRPTEDGKFRAFTNKRPPGNALLGEFDDLDAAADAVAELHR